jgi:hypothetical protein
MTKSIIVAVLAAVLCVFASGCALSEPAAGEPAAPPDEAAPAGIPPFSIFVEGRVYNFFDIADGKRLDTEGLEYLGSVIACTTEDPGGVLAPSEEFTAFGFPAGTEIFRINEDSLYIEYTGAFTLGFETFGNMSAFSEYYTERENLKLFEIGTVKVIENQTEHEPYIVPIGSISDGLAVTMVFQPLEAIAETLPAIIYTDDFELIIDGEYADNWVMTLYDSQFEMRREVRNSAAFSSMPDEAGEYFLGVHVLWQNNESGADFEQASIVYYFKVVIA